MPTLDGIQVQPAVSVTCSEHGHVATTFGENTARIYQRLHYERRHQPDPAGRICQWRYVIGGTEPGYLVCTRAAAHDDRHEDADGNQWGEIGSLPREGDA